ncbi:MAG TPA: CBS domain-containing protein [Nitrososphaerales archaeon]|nr:CBS domain-containing protein [Nitrososphaerales archaeon]
MPITMKVKDVMDKNVVTIDSGASVDDAVKMMIQNKVWSLVVEKEGASEGVVTERDVIRRCVAKGLPTSKTAVGRIASSPLISVGPDSTLREAMDLMAAKDVRRLFVIDKGKIIGRVTQTEVFQSTLSVMEILSSLSNVL